MYIKYKSIGDMNYDILRNLSKFPHDIDLIVGIPRSGMLPANLLALYMNKPYTDIDSFIHGHIYGTGVRGKNIDRNKRNKILIIDDSVNSGNALKEAKIKLKSILAEPKYHFIFAAIYASNWGRKIVDIYCELIEGTRLFQWNIFHHPIISESCFDIDGVLCVNPPIDDDGSQYLNYIKNAPALYVPTREIETIVTCRLEKYRDVTTEWLARNNVKYKKMIMLDFPNKEARIKWGKHGVYKGEIYKKSTNMMFIESSLHEAKEILRISGKPVFCTETFELLNNESLMNHSKSKLGVLLNRILEKQK